MVTQNKEPYFSYTKLREYLFGETIFSPDFYNLEKTFSFSLNTENFQWGK